jgi:protocatechuate 3,4-dioxygenase alpha subunit
VEVTPSQTVGPFFGFALPFEGDASGTPDGSAETIRIEGQVLDGDGPVSDALVEIWEGTLFARCRTDPEGAFHFTVMKPPAVGGAPHLNVAVFARGLLRQLQTRLYFPDEEDANARDELLGLVDPDRRQTLIAEDAGGALRFDIRLQGEQETVFFRLPD